MSVEQRCCPQCKSEELYQDHLSQKGSAWPILFGGTLFSKKELLAYACKECGFVSLFIGPSVNESGEIESE